MTHSTVETPEAALKLPIYRKIYPAYYTMFVVQVLSSQLAPS